MTYVPHTSVYYLENIDTTQDEDRLIPSPQISIEPEFLYVNNNLIGYNYIVTLNGQATSFDRTKSDAPPESGVGFYDTMKAVENVKKLLQKNGRTLKVVRGDKDIIVARNGLLQSLNFEETENTWFNYAKYTATLSFDTLLLAGCSGTADTFNCGLMVTELNDDNTLNLVDMKKFKVKSVKDNWSFDISNIYNQDSEFKIYNEYIDVTYNIEAVGKHFKATDDKDNSVKPAHHQAKAFCLHRLDQEIKRLKDFKVGPLLNTQMSTSCSAQSTSINNVSTEKTTSLFYSLDKNKFKLYNESINYRISETDGSFSLTYKAILKYKDAADQYFGDTDCIHKISINRSISDNDLIKTSTITVNGEIEGLIETDLLGGLNGLKIDKDNGTILAEPDLMTTTKYDNALAAYEKVCDVAGQGSDEGSKLKSGFLTSKLKITKKDLDPTGNTEPPVRKSHETVHNYTIGTINYSEEYNNININAQSGVSVTRCEVSFEDEVDNITEYVIPFRGDNGQLIVKNGKTRKRLNLAIDGVIQVDCCDPSGITQDQCSGSGTLPPGVPGTGITNYTITEDRYNQNYSDGSYTITRTYISNT